ncbi:MAG: hypothetical protein KF784_03275 [Fimbriimonadaceae bacterium]|nr:hypothetical protein [Fimbriimonadaceae bacterium]
MGRVALLALFGGILLLGGCTKADDAEGQNARNMTPQQESEQRKDAYSAEQREARASRPR